MNPKLGRILFITIFILLIVSGTTLSLMYRDVRIGEPTQIEEIDLPPSFVTVPPEKIYVGDYLEYVVRVTDQDTDEDELFVLIEASPLWINMVGGILTGEPGDDDIGYHSVDISVTDGTNKVHQEFYIVVESNNDQDL